MSCDFFLPYMEPACACLSSCDSGGLLLPHVTDEETEACRGDLLKAAKPGLNPRWGVPTPGCR